MNLEVGLDSEILKDSLSVDQFLCHASGGGDHRQSAVLEFLGLHLLEGLGVGGLEAERVKTNVARCVIGPQETGLAVLDVLGVDPSDVEAFGFGGTNSDDQRDPKAVGYLFEVIDGGSLNIGVE